MLNVGTGNLVVQATDIDIAERGLGLVFQRTYNSQSLHDANGDDGSEPAIFGNGWTNTFDAHLVFQQSGDISVYDIDGTRCDYTPQKNGTWTPCTGEHSTLEPDPSTNCAYWWIKKNGTAYYFYSPIVSVTCSTPISNYGRLYEIVGRNSNNSISLTYSWQANEPKTSQYITGLQVTHSDGQSLAMTFGSVGQSGPTELATITYPDPSNPATSVTARFSYDSLGDLVEVDRPGNDSTAQNSSLLNGKGVPAGDLPETYGYNHTMLAACGPRATISKWIANGNGQGTDGSCLTFTYDGNGNIAQWQVNGVLNFTPNDNQNTPLQNGLLGWQTWYTANFSYGMSNSACTHESSGTTVMCDTDGHSAKWTIDSSYRVSTRQEYTGEASPTNLVTTETWDPNNNLIATVDPGGNETDYAYDANGNTIAMALPSVNDAPSTYRPTSQYSYDGNNNLISFCDPDYSHNHGLDWTSPPQTQQCPTAPGTPGAPGPEVYQYGSGDSNEPFGKLIATFTRMGYSYSISYNTAQGGGGDYGLPTQVQGQAISQPIDTGGATPTRTPVQNFTYDQYGNLVSYNKASGETWTLIYDADNRNVAKIDPDTYPSVTCSYLDGSTFYSETPAQHGYDGGGSVSNGTTLCPDQLGSTQPTAPQYAPSQNHDSDGDVIAETRHYMQGPVFSQIQGMPSPDPNGVTQKFYDGLDRLVEVKQPSDGAADQYWFAWMTRYIYDLNPSGNGPDEVNVDGSGVTAYGNLYQTQECLPTGGSTPTVVTIGPGNPKISGCSFQELRGNAFDGLDRTTQKFEDAFGTTAELTSNYDTTPGTMGLLSKTTNAVGGTTTYSYDAAERLTEKLYGDPSRTPTEDYTYDYYGHVNAITSSVFGTESYVYDQDGRLSQKSDPTGGGYASPGIITYGYFADGMRANLSLAINPEPEFNNVKFTGTNVLQYAYQTDGKMDHERVNISSSQWDYKWTYTAADRELTQTDPDYKDTIEVYPVKNCCANPQPLTLQAKTYTYDQYGQIASLTFPAGGQLPHFAYDAEGEVIDDFGPESGFTYPPAPQYLYTIRGELIWSPQPPLGGQLNSPWGTPTIIRATANGAVCQPSVTCTFDTRTSQTYSQSASNPNRSPSYPSYAYDPAGRNKTTAVNCTYNGQQQDTGTLTNLYDTENRIISSSAAMEDPFVLNGNNGNAGACFVLSTPGTLAWGNSGHPYDETIPAYQGPTSSTAFHWDGDQVLYSVTNLPGFASVVLYLGMLGEVPLTSDGNNKTQDVFTNDRDYAGQQYQYHSSTAFSSWSPPGARFEFNTAKLGTLVFNSPSWGGNQAVDANNQIITIAARTDGYQMSGGTIQGVRSYDSTGSQWTSPDAYAGDVDDPVSQKPFMWNGNDPLKYSDPSGYTALVTETTDTANPLQTDVNITLYVDFTGSGDTPQMEQAITSAIESAWSGAVGNYNVTTTVVTDTTGIPRNEVNTISISSGGKGDNFNVNQLNNLMKVGNDPTDTYGFAHEAGHLMGLPDLYDSMKYEPLTHESNPNYGNPLPGHELDIMASQAGSVTPFDIRSIILSPSNVTGP